MNAGYNTICPKCRDRYTSEDVKEGEIAVKRCSNCPPAVMLQSQMVIASHLNQGREIKKARRTDRRRAPPSLTGDTRTMVPGEYEERRRSKRTKDPKRETKS
jgi:hypothetical protein